MTLSRPATSSSATSSSVSRPAPPGSAGLAPCTFVGTLGARAPFMLVYDVVIVGGGPAGLSAALVLGRCRRRVLLFDEGKPRNARSQGVHGFLTRDGISPWELRRLAREELRPYEVELRDEPVEDVRRVAEMFEVTTARGERCAARKVLLATGMVDTLPRLPGALELYGTGILSCPYCDGWEHRDQPLGAYGPGEGGEPLAEPTLQRLASFGIVVRTERVVAFEGNDGRLSAVVLENGARVPRSAVFVHLGQEQRSPLAERLGCERDETEALETFWRQSSAVPGLYLAGDACRDVKLAVVAAAHGARAAQAIHQALRQEDTSRS